MSDGSAAVEAAMTRGCRVPSESRSMAAGECFVGAGGLQQQGLQEGVRDNFSPTTVIGAGATSYKII